MLSIGLYAKYRGMHDIALKQNIYCFVSIVKGWLLMEGFLVIP